VLLVATVQQLNMRNKSAQKDCPLPMRSDEERSQLHLSRRPNHHCRLESAIAAVIDGGHFGFRTARELEPHHLSVNCPARQQIDPAGV
jgi:hypothetical protein